MSNFKLPNGNELLIGLNINNEWTVSCWDEELNCIWSMSFEDEQKAMEQFNKSKAIAIN